MDSRCLIRDDENKQGPLWTSGHASPGHSLREGREGAACVVGAALWDGETYQLVSRQGQDADHEMAGDLGMSTDADMAPAKLILEAGVGPLDTGPDPEPHVLGIDMAYCTPRPRLPLTRRAPKKLSSTSTIPNSGRWVSQAARMRSRKPR